MIKEMCPAEQEMRPKILIAAVAADGLCVSFFLSFLRMRGGQKKKEFGCLIKIINIGWKKI